MSDSWTQIPKRILLQAVFSLQKCSLPSLSFHLQSIKIYIPHSPLFLTKYCMSFLIVITMVRLPIFLHIMYLHGFSYAIFLWSCSPVNVQRAEGKFPLAVRFYFPTSPTNDCGPKPLKPRTQSNFSY